MNRNFRLSIVTIDFAEKAHIGTDCKNDITPQRCTPRSLNKEMVAPRRQSPLLRGKGRGVRRIPRLRLRGAPCRYPAIEELRKEYCARVTFVVRRMPSHKSSTHAALAIHGADNAWRRERHSLAERQRSNKPKRASVVSSGRVKRPAWPAFSTVTISVREPKCRATAEAS